MLNNKDFNYFIDSLNKMYPDADCELNYNSVFQLLIAVVLSAQTTDIQVNKVTNNLFKKYPDAFALANASYSDVISIIHSIGLYNAKAKNIINLSKYLKDNYNGEVPSTFEELTSLPGVGRKTANVVLMMEFNTPRMPVDTHVERVSKRIGIVDKNSTTLDVENELVKRLDPKDLRKVHHLLIHFGRYFCKSKSPNCIECPFKSICNKED